MSAKECIESFFLLEMDKMYLFNKILILKMTYGKFNLRIIIIMIFTLSEKHIVLFSEVTVSQRPLHEVC